MTCAPISLSIRLTFMYHKTLKSLVLNCGFSFFITHDISKIKGTEMVSDILDKNRVIKRYRRIKITDRVPPTSAVPPVINLTLQNKLGEPKVSVLLKTSTLCKNKTHTEMKYLTSHDLAMRRILIIFVYLSSLPVAIWATPPEDG